ncbi:uncharacterized protein [Tenebrio molitor]|uniref:uncharacterized protein n=1 Tax=Tenebrio molitor TaxID=7067 RepID=UPI00362484C2
MFDDANGFNPQESEQNGFASHPVDPTFLSAAVIATINNNVGLLSSLFQLGLPLLDSRDNEGNTILHISVINESADIFDFLLNKTDVDVNAVNLYKCTALAAAVTTGVTHDKVSYILKLIKKGANVNAQDNLNFTPLHYACSYNLEKICHVLLQNGSDVNVQNVLGETPLHIACQYASPEIIYMLLYYGADVSIPCAKGTIPLMVTGNVKMELRMTLYNYTFDKNMITMSLDTVIRAMILQWPLFSEMLNKVSDVTYDESSLQHLNDSLADIKLAHFKMFLKKFDYVFTEMLLNCCTLTTYLTSVECMKRTTLEFVDFLYLLLGDEFVYDVIQNCCMSVLPVCSLVKIFHRNKFPLKILTELVCHMLSYGLTITSTDLNAVYVFYGRCELFQIMLHMEIEVFTKNTHCCALYDYEVIQKSIMPNFIYDINLNIDKFLENPQTYLLMDLDVLLDYFALPKLKEFFLGDGSPPRQTSLKLMRLPSVPCLVELARNAARDHIIKTFKIKNSSQFYTLIKWLPINDIYKKILSFEMKLY